MLTLALILAAIDPLSVEDAAAAARTIVSALPRTTRVAVQPVQNRTTEHLDAAAFTSALQREISTQHLAGDVHALKIDVHLIERASEKRYVVLAALVVRATEQTTWLREVVITKQPDTPPGPPPPELRDRFDEDDAARVGRVLFAECLSEGWLDEAGSATVSIRAIENRTDEHVPVGFLRRSLEHAALADPRIRLFERDAEYTQRTVIEASAQWAAERRTTVFRLRLEAVRVKDGHLACVHTAVVRKTR